MRLVIRWLKGFEWDRGSWRELRVIAKQRDVPYQSLMKMLLADKVAEIRRITSGNALPRHGD